MGIRSKLEWLRNAPAGTKLEARQVLEWLKDVEVEPEPAPELTALPPSTWAERLWVVPAETRLSTADVLEALGKGRTWLYRVMDEERGPLRLPHRKFEGQLVFTAGEVRAWIRDNEDVIHAGPMDAGFNTRGAA